MVEGEMTDPTWDKFVGRARKAAERGEKQYLLLRFLSERCADDSRAINDLPNSHMPRILRGEAANLRAVAHRALAIRIQPLGSSA